MQNKSYYFFLLKKIILKPCEMFRKVTNKFLRDQISLKHEIFEDQIFFLHDPSIQILHFNSGNILFKVSCGIWLVNVSPSTELLSVCVSWGNGAYAITFVRVHVCLVLCLCSHFWAFWAKLNQILSERWVFHWWWHSCSLWNEAPRMIREATGAPLLGKVRCLFTPH